MPRLCTTGMRSRPRFPNCAAWSCCTAVRRKNLSYADPSPCANPALPVSQRLTLISGATLQRAFGAGKGQVVFYGLPMQDLPVQTSPHLKDVCLHSSPRCFVRQFLLTDTKATSKRSYWFQFSLGDRPWRDQDRYASGQFLFTRPSQRPTESMNESIQQTNRS